MKIVALPVQQLSNGIYCGVFALAFINYILSEKKTPVEVIFDTSKMRTTCLRVRMPGAKSDNRLFDKQMVKCDGCCQWFHRMCQHIPEKPFNEKYVKWYCHRCLLLEKA